MTLRCRTFPLSAAAGLELSSATTKTALLKLRKAQLIYELSNRGLATAGKKEVLALRLLSALRSPEGSEELREAAGAEEEAEAEIRRLGQRLLSLDESVGALKESVAGAEETQVSLVAVKEILVQLSELQAEAEADQAEVEELQVLEEFFREGEEELVPDMQRRKAETVARLRELKAGITVTQTAAPLPPSPPACFLSAQRGQSWSQRSTALEDWREGGEGRAAGGSLEAVAAALTARPSAPSSRDPLAWTPPSRPSR